MDSLSKWEYTYPAHFIRKEVQVQSGTDTPYFMWQGYPLKTTRMMNKTLKEKRSIIRKHVGDVKTVTKWATVI